MPERLAIVGGDAAGMSAASTARRREPTLNVVAFERGPYTSFSACGIPFFVGGLFEDSDRLVSRSPDEHRPSPQSTSIVACSYDPLLVAARAAAKVL